MEAKFYDRYGKLLAKVPCTWAYHNFPRILLLHLEPQSCSQDLQETAGETNRVTLGNWHFHVLYPSRTRSTVQFHWRSLQREEIELV